MTDLVKRCTNSFYRIKKRLPSKWQSEQVVRQGKLLNLRTVVDSFLMNGDLELASDLCVRYISEFPGDRSGYQVLGQVFEVGGNSATAAQCFNARIPEARQDDLFGTDISSYSAVPSSVHKYPGHRAERCGVCTKWSEQSALLQQFERTELCAGATQTLIVEDGSLWYDGFNTVPFDRNGRPIMDSVIGNIAPVLVNVAQRRPRRYHGDVVLLGARGTNNYFHWMTDILPKLAVLEKSGLEWDRNTLFAFRNVSKPFQIRTLELLGIERSQWLQTFKGNDYIIAKRIIIPQLDNKMCLTMGAWVPEYLKQTFLTTDLSSVARRRIFVSRDPSNAQGRDIANADQVSTFFLSRGYEIVYPEQYGIAEQAELFSTASHVAAPHGAGLANLHFCSPGTQVYEFHGAHFSPCYWALCEKLGLTYRNLNCAAAQVSEYSHLDAAKTLDARRGQGFSIPIELLEDFI